MNSSPRVWPMCFTLKYVENIMMPQESIHLELSKHTFLYISYDGITWALEFIIIIILFLFYFW